MTDNKIILAFLIVISSFICNMLWAFYIKAVSEEKMLKSAVFGEMIVGAGALSTYLYVNDPWMIIPMLVGGFLGTLTSKQTKKLFKIK